MTFKTAGRCLRRLRWVRFPHAPATATYGVSHTQCEAPFFDPRNKLDLRGLMNASGCPLSIFNAIGCALTVTARSWHTAAEKKSRDFIHMKYEPPSVLAHAAWTAWESRQPRLLFRDFSGYASATAVRQHD